MIVILGNPPDMLSVNFQSQIDVQFGIWGQKPINEFDVMVKSQMISSWPSV